MKQAMTEPDRPTRAVVVHGHAHALAALQAARRLPCRLVLLSASGAAGFLGPAWWAALMAGLQPQMATTDASDLLDCGSSAGRAMEALRIGLRQLILDSGCPQQAAVLARGTALDATIELARPPALDLADRNAGRRLAEWLQTGTTR